MPSNTEISVSQLLRLVGVPGAPAIIDARDERELAADPHLIPGSFHCPAGSGRELHLELEATGSIVVVCRDGGAASQGLAAMLRQDGWAAETLEGGFEAWRAAGAPVVKTAKVPRRNAEGRTVWVTRARPKIDRVACPWLIRRFVDPRAAFLFVSASEVMSVAERFGAVPFDVEGVFWSHRGDRCTFDTMIEEFGLKIEPLERLAAIVRAADTARLDAVPQAAGLMAASLGLSRMYKDDLQQIEAGFLLYDAFYRWCRDAVDETHNWPAHGTGKSK